MFLNYKNLLIKINEDNLFKNNLSSLTVKYLSIIFTFTTKNI